MNGLKMYPSEHQESVESLFETHATLVKRIAHHLIGKLPASVQVDDLIQAGMIGLLEAAKNFDQTKGASFKTYAGIRIRGSMLDEIRRGDWAPRSVHKNSRMIENAIWALENKMGRDAKDYEIAEYLEIPLNDYHTMLRDTNGSKIFGYEDITGGLDAPGEQVPSPFPEPLEKLELQRFKGSLSHCVANLPEKERLVLSLYYEEELNLREIGEVLGVSESRISQIHSQAMHRLKARMQEWKA